MEKEHASLTKTCSICGQVKPLAAFLYMSGSAGAEYGSVCADCRKKGSDKPRITETDGGIRGSSGAVVDSKSKAQADLDKRELRDETQEEYYEEREEAETEQKNSDTKKEQKATEEKQHRQTFLNRNTLSTKKSDTAGTTNEARWRTDQITAQAGAEAASNMEKVTKDELQEKGVDQASTEDLRHGMKAKHKGVAFQQGAAFQHFAARLGKSSTFSQHTPDKPISSETLSDAIEKNWGPNRKK